MTNKGIAMFYFRIIFFAIICMPICSEELQIDCYSHLSKDICSGLEGNKPSAPSPEIGSEKWRDQLLDNLGSSAWDYLQKGAKDFTVDAGKKLAKTALLSVLESYAPGLSGVVKGALGQKEQPDLFALHAQRIINEINETERVLLEHEDLQCIASIQAEALGVKNSINQYLNDFMQSRIDNISSLRLYIHDLNKIKAYYDANTDFSRHACFNQHRAITFQWYVKIVSLSLDLLAEVQHLEGIRYGIDSDQINSNILNDYKIIISDLHGGSTFRTAVNLIETGFSGKTGSRSNAFDDLNETYFGGFRYSINTNGICRSYYARGSMEAIYDRENIPFHARGHVSEYRGPVSFCDQTKYYYKGKEYIIKSVGFHDYDEDGSEYHAFSMAVGFNKSTFGRWTNGSGQIRSLEIYNDHKELSYAQVLQTFYRPYVELIDEFWNLVEEKRPVNNIDLEYASTSGLSLLDYDGLSIAEEKYIGTDPRNGDSDSDGFSDGFEYHNRDKGFDPLVWHYGLSDYDGDGFTDIDEYKEGTDLFDAKSNPNARLTSTLVPIISLILN